MRVGVHDSRAVEIETPDGRIRRPIKGSGGMYDLSERDAKALVREGGFLPGVGGVTVDRPGGYECPRGHLNYFRTCGRCADIDARAALESAGFGPLDPRQDGGALAVYPDDERDDEWCNCTGHRALRRHLEARDAAE